jgi:hypothetical protein
MRLREERSGCALLVPAVIHDGRDFPSYAQRVQSAMLQDYANPRMTSDSRKGEELAECIAKWVPTVAVAIGAAPPCDPAWEQDHVAAMDRAFEDATQKHVPSWGA